MTQDPWSIGPTAHNPAPTTDDEPSFREVPLAPKSTLIPVSWPLFWRFAKWRGGVPLGIVLVVIGAADPNYLNVAVFGAVILMFAFLRRTLGKWRTEIRQLSAHLGAVRSNKAAAAKLAAQQAKRASAQPGYYQEWVGSDEQFAGPYAQTETHSAHDA